jgi:hypothetical protein
MQKNRLSFTIFCGSCLEIGSSMAVLIRLSFAISIKLGSDNKPLSPKPNNLRVKKNAMKNPLIIFY